MPIINSGYTPPFYLFNGHLQTIVPAFFHKIKPFGYTRQRIITRDEDFLDLDWLRNDSETLVVLCHGLEGNSTSPYILKTAREIHKNSWDILAWNYRGCSGEMNRKLNFYHSGFTQDLEDVIQHVLNSKQYKQLYLCGFSLGGNIILKYLGEQGTNIPSAIKATISFSAPCDLLSGAEVLAKASARIYMKRFLRSFKAKFEAKLKMFPGQLDISGYDKIRDFFEFDNRYTAPMFGFRDVYDYYAKASSRPFLPKICVPSLIVNAKNDPFLGKGCYPVEEAELNPLLYLEMPESGGHVGFPQKPGNWWPAERMFRFFREVS